MNQVLSTKFDKKSKIKNMITVYFITGIIIGAEFLFYRFIFSQRMTKLEDLGTVLGELVYAIFLGVIVVLIWPIFWLLSIFSSEFVYSLEKFIAIAPNADTSLLKLTIQSINITPIILFAIAFILQVYQILINAKSDKAQIKRKSVVFFQDVSSEQSKRLIERTNEDKLLLKLYEEEITRLFLKIQSLSNKIHLLWLDDLVKLKNEILRFDERLEGITKIEDLVITYPILCNTIKYKLSDYDTFKSEILKKMNISIEKLEKLSTIDEIAPKLTFKWLNDSAIDVQLFIAEINNINTSINRILIHNEKDKGSWLNIENGTEILEISSKIIASNYNISNDDFSEINLQLFDQISRETVKTIGNNIEDYNIANIVIKSQNNIIFTKQLLKIQQIFEKGIIDQGIIFNIDLSSFDKKICDLLRRSWLKKWGSINIFNIAHYFDIGLIHSAKYLQQLKKVENKAKKEVITVSDQIKIEGYVQSVLKGIKKGTIESYKNPAEIIHILELTSVKTTFMIINDVNKRIIKKERDKNIKTKRKEKSYESKKTEDKKLTEFQKKMLKMGRKETD